MLTVVKSLNNNIILAVTEGNQELVAFGTEIGFKRKKGDRVSLEEATKIFQTNVNVRASQLLEGISTDVLAVTEKIVKMAEQQLKKKLSPSILFALADHLRFAIERTAQELDSDMPIQWEIPHLYFEEYELGKQALQLIEKETGNRLPISEASFIALHVVNAQMDNPSMGETIQVTQLTKKIVKIIQSLFQVTLDKTSVNYSRFITHLRYFIARQKSQQTGSVEMDGSLKEIIQDHYIKSYACGLLVKEMLRREFSWDINEGELIYLVIHIERIIQENQA